MDRNYARISNTDVKYRRGTVEGICVPARTAENWRLCCSVLSSRTIA